MPTPRLLVPRQRFPRLLFPLWGEFPMLPPRLNDTFTAEGPGPELLTMRRTLFLLALCCLPLASACNQAASNGSASPAKAASGGVAVIDLDEVARLLGRETAIKQSLTAREANLNQQLETMRVSYANQLRQRKQELTPEPASNELAQLQSFEQKAVAHIQQAQRQAQQDLDGQKRALINTFRDEVKPIASQVAATKGLSIVVSKNDTFLFAFDSAVDITQEVAERMKPLASSASPDQTTYSPQTPVSGAGSPNATLPDTFGANGHAPPANENPDFFPAEPDLLPSAPQRPIRAE